VRWEHVDPVTGTRRESDASGNGVLRAEFDALGNEIALTDPEPPESMNYDYVGNYDGGGFEQVNHLPETRLRMDASLPEN
jgi:hypothetical protein